MALAVEGMKLEDLLCSTGADRALQEALPSLFMQCGRICQTLRETSVKSKSTTNSFGDVQLNVDMVAENSLRSWAGDCALVRAVCSEEETMLQEVHSEGSLVVCWDPLDGSSIADCNWSLATIVGIWQVGKNGISWNGPETLIGATGRQQVASVLVIYGPRMSALLCVCGRTYELIVNSDGSSRVVGTPSIKADGAKIFSPANLRAAQDLPGYAALIQKWMEKRYTLRPSGASVWILGGLGPDVYQIFVKGHGIFCNPASPKAPAKLRVAFEVAPIALLVEGAGGETSDGSKSALDVVLTEMCQRTAFICGTPEEVRSVQAALQ